MADRPLLSDIDTPDGSRYYGNFIHYVKLDGKWVVDEGAEDRIAKFFEGFGDFEELSSFEAHEMRVVRPLIVRGDYLVCCICGDAQRVEWFNRHDPDTPLHERVTAAYRAHLKDTP